ncbi:9731_t:CDS:2, partial [Scutellospora calospora]
LLDKIAVYLLKYRIKVDTSRRDRRGSRVYTDYRRRRGRRGLGCSRGLEHRRGRKYSRG